MLKLAMLEILARGIPEGVLFVFAAYLFSKTKFKFLNVIISIILYAVLIYIIRLLPIQYGVNTILTLMTMIVLFVVINKIEIIKSIQAGIIAIIIEFLCEGINIFFIQNVFKADINYIFSKPELKTLYGIPSLLIFGLIILVYYILFLKKSREV